MQPITDEGRHAFDARDSVRVLHRLLRRRRSLPAPEAHSVLGALAAIQEELPETLSLLTRSIVRSLDEYEVYQADGTDPVEQIVRLQEHLQAVAEQVVGISSELRAAQAVIAQQGYRNPL